MCRAALKQQGAGSLVAAALLVGPASAFAQAWLPPKGEASISIGYEYVYVKEHLFAGGERQDRGHIRENSLLPDLGYGITDKLAVRIGLPYISAKYNGARPHQLPIDDGSYHGAFQDFRIEVRYMAFTDPLVVTPFAAVVLPSHDYTYFAHSAVGRDLKEESFGLNLARRLDRILPDAYVHGRYSFTLVEKVLNISHNRSNFDLELGYFLTPAISVRAMGVWQRGYGGIELPVTGIPLPLFLYHDQLARSDYFNMGGGLAYAATANLDVFGNWFTTLSGKNGHAIHDAVTVGASVNFSPAQLVRKMTRRKSQQDGQQ
jgi:hypothetical protein